MARSLDSLEVFVRQKIVNDRWTYKTLSEYLIAANPQAVRGFSVRSIERFCSEHNIHRTSRLSKHEVAESVRQAVREVRVIIIHYINIIIVLIPLFYDMYNNIMQLYCQ